MTLIKASAPVRVLAVLISVTLVTSGVAPGIDPIKGPEPRSADPRTAQQLPDHRVAAQESRPVELISAAEMATRRAAAHAARERAEQQQVRRVTLARAAAARARAEAARAVEAARVRDAAARSAAKAPQSPAPAARFSAPRALRAAPSSSTVESLTARRDRLLASLAYPWQPLGFTVVFAPGRKGYLGLTDPGARTITVFVRSTHTDSQLRVTLAHELGHAVDLTYGNAARRAEYLQLRGIGAGRSWWPCDACSDYSSGAGDFAEVFAVWLVGSTTFRSTLAGRPGPAELASLRHLFGP